MQHSITRSEILANRKKWIEYLKDPSRKKAIGWLQDPHNEEHRCCLGHGCYALGIKGNVNLHDVSDITIRFGKFMETKAAPIEMALLLGLWGSFGACRPNHHFDRELLKKILTTMYLQNPRSLALINDETQATPQQIGEFLEAVIEGGEDTPFKPLEDYPEVL